MRSYLHIKGKSLWRGCACLTLGIVLACCGEVITGVDQRGTAVVGSTINITVHIDIPTVGNGGPDNLILGILVPKGWKAAQNTTITYTSPTLGDGTMSLVPATPLPKNGGGLSWSAYMKKTFGIGGNLIDDMEWVAYQADKAYPHNGSEIKGDLLIKMKVGADGNNTLVKLGYVITDTGNGFISDGNGTYYSEKVTPCFSLTGGPGDLVDFCNPQLTIVDPPKALDNDFISITFDNNLVKTDLSGQTDLYLCATAYTPDNKAITICEQTNRTQLNQTAATSKKFQVTIWPRSFFGLQTGQSLTRIEYFITNKANTVKIGYGNTTAPFVYTFKCG